MSRAAQASEQDAALGRPTDEPQSSSSTAHRLVDDWIYDVRAAQTGRRGAAPGQRLSVHGGPIRLAGYPPKPPAGVPSRSAAGSVKTFFALPLRLPENRTGHVERSFTIAAAEIGCLPQNESNTSSPFQVQRLLSVRDMSMGCFALLNSYKNQASLSTMTESGSQSKPSRQN